MMEPVPLNLYTTRKVQTHHLAPRLLTPHSKTFLEHQLLFSGGKMRNLRLLCCKGDKCFEHTWMCPKGKPGDLQI